MTDSSAPEVRGRRWPPGLLGMLVLVAAVEGTLDRHALDFTRFPIHDWRASGRAATAEAPSCGVLCFGDSLVKFGLLADVLGDRLGTRAYNLAVCDGQAPSSYFLLRRALESGARPSAVVVDYVPHLLAPGPRQNLREWPELLTIGEWVDLSLTSRQAAFSAAVALGGLLPAVRARHEIRAGLRAALRGESASRREEVLDCLRTWQAHRGSQASPARPAYRGEVDEANPAYFPRTWRCHPVNEVYVGRFLDLAEQHGIPVYWLLPPVAPRFQQRRDEAGLEAEFGRFLGRLRDRHPNLVVVDARRLGLDATRFIDPLHLNEQGARLLTREVAGVLGGRGGRSPTRWVTLSADREPRLAAARLAKDGPTREPITRRGTPSGPDPCAATVGRVARVERPETTAAPRAEPR